MATGHYVQRVERNGKAELHAVLTPTKTRATSSSPPHRSNWIFCGFPLAGMTRNNRALATPASAECLDKPDSQGICLSSAEWQLLSDVIEKLRAPARADPGEIVACP